MNTSLLTLEFIIVGLGLVVLLTDLWLPLHHRRRLGMLAALGVAIAFVVSYRFDLQDTATAFHGMFILDGTALFLKKLFLVGAFLVLLLSVEYGERLESGISEYNAILLFALSGMMFAASSHHLAMVFVSVELITVAFFVLVAYRRRRVLSLEAGIKFLILGAFASGFLLYGIALVYGVTGALDFPTLAERCAAMPGNPVLVLGLLLILAGIAFKVALVPFHIWAPDIYQGAPLPTTAFLAVGSKAAGLVLMLRIYGAVLVKMDWPWGQLLALLAGASILYGNLCALPQRNLKRLLAYSSIANAGYMVMGLAALSPAGIQALLYYAVAYLFAVLAVFFVLCVTSAGSGNMEVDSLAGLHRRAPWLAATLTLGLISLAGIPPMAGFFGKFLLFQAVLQRGSSDPAFYALAGVAFVGVAISIYYYFNVVRIVYWGEEIEPLASTHVGRSASAGLAVCVAGILYLGLLPGNPVHAAGTAIQSLL